VSTLRSQWKQNTLVYNAKKVSKVNSNSILFPRLANQFSKFASNAKNFSKGAGSRKSVYFGGGGCQDRSGNPYSVQPHYTPHNQVTFFVLGVYKDRAVQYFVTTFWNNFRTSVI